MASVVVELTGNEQKLLASMNRILAAQDKLEDGFKKVKKSSDIGDAFGKGATALTGMLAGVTSLGVATAAYRENVADTLAMYKESLEVVRTLAAAQSGASRNLTGLSPQDKARALAEAKRIQSEIGFSDAALLTNAVGAGYSASGNLAATTSAVRAAAQITRLTPDELGVTAAGALDLARGSGITDAERNIGFLLSAGSVSRVEDPAMLAGSLAPTVTSGVNTLPKQDREEAAREIAAVWSTLNQFATDKTGASTQTATTVLLSKIQGVFEGVAGTEDNQAELDKLLADEKAKQKVNPRTGTTTGGLSAKEKKRVAELQDLIANPQSDPGTLFGRIEAIRKDDRLKDALFETEFGEAAFKGGYSALFEGGSQFSKDVASNKKAITFDATTFRNTVSELTGLTPEMSVGTADAAAQAEINAVKSNPNQAAIASIGGLVSETLRNNRRGMFGGALDIKREQWAEGWYAPSSPTEAMQTARSRLMSRRGLLEDDRDSWLPSLSRESSDRKIANIDRTLDKMDEIFGRFIQRESTAAPSPNAIRSQANAGSKQ